MEITINKKLTTRDAPGGFEKAIRDRLTFTNPKRLENNKMGRWNGKLPRHLKPYESGDRTDNKSSRIRNQNTKFT